MSVDDIILNDYFLYVIQIFPLKKSTNHVVATNCVEKAIYYYRN